LAAGGGSDTLGRILATQLNEQTGAQFFVENRGGAGGLIGTAAAAKADPNGYTFVMSSIATHVIAPASGTAVSFHPLAIRSPGVLTPSVEGTGLSGPDRNDLVRGIWACGPAG